MFWSNLKKFQNPPDGYSWYHVDDSIWWIRDDWAQFFTGENPGDFTGFVQRYSVRIHADRGRSSMTVLEFPGSSSSFLLRHYARGGFLRAFNRDLYLGAPRSFNELRTARAVSKAGIPTREIIAAVVHAGPGPFHREDLLVKEIPEVSTIKKFFQDRSFPSEKAFLLKKNIIRKIGTYMARLHDHGVAYPDLNTTNFLIQFDGCDEGFRLYVIDFDQSWIQEPLSNVHKRRNVRRTMRSFERLRRSSSGFTRTDLVRVFASYAQFHSDFRRNFRHYLKRWRNCMVLRDFFEFRPRNNG